MPLSWDREGSLKIQRLESDWRGHKRTESFQYLKELKVVSIETAIWKEIHPTVTFWFSIYYQINCCHNCLLPFQGNPLPSQGSVNYSNLSDVNSRDDEKRNSEIRASLRSLKTNLMIIVVTLASAAILNHSPHEINTPIISAIKASSPVVTMFANFGKVKEYIEELKESFRAYYTSYCDKWLCDYKL